MDYIQDNVTPSASCVEARFFCARDIFMSETTAAADLRLRIQAKANAANLAFGTMFGAYAGAVFSTRLERITTDILYVGMMLMIVAYGTISPATTHPRNYRRKRWWVDTIGEWSTVVGAPFLWFQATGRLDLGAGILFVWMLWSNAFSFMSRRHRQNQRRIDINNKRWESRLKRRIDSADVPDAELSQPTLQFIQRVEEMRRWKLRRAPVSQDAACLWNEAMHAPRNQ